MSNTTSVISPIINIQEAPAEKTIDVVNQGLNKRYNAERRFKLYGLLAVCISLSFLSILFASIIGKGYTAFQQTYVQLDVLIDPDVVSDSPNTADYSGLIKKSVYKMFPEVKGRRDKRALNKLFSSGAAYQLRKMVLENRDIVGKSLSVWVPADDDIDMLIKGHIDRNVPEGERRLSDKQLSWVDRLIAENKIKKQFNTNFFNLIFCN